MTSEDMAAEFAKVSGRYGLTELIHCLTEACSTDASFALAASGDAVKAFERLVRTHSNAREEHVTTACQLFSAAIFNAMTYVQADITYLEDEANG